MSDRDVTPPALPAHVRTIRIEAVEAVATGQEPLLRVRGVLEDRRPRGAPDWLAHDGDVIHRMEVTLTVRHPDLTITAAEGRMPTFPYPDVCPGALPGLDSLVGVAIGRGFTRAVNERIGRDQGCTHLTALVLAMGPVVRQGAGAAFGFTRTPEPGNPSSGRPPTLPWFINSCHAWREGGALHARWLTGQPDRDR